VVFLSLNEANLYAFLLQQNNFMQFISFVVLAKTLIWQGFAVIT
jgi:hypothetical protein